MTPAQYFSQADPVVSLVCMVVLLLATLLFSIPVLFAKDKLEERQTGHLVENIGAILKATFHP